MSEVVNDMNLIPEPTARSAVPGVSPGRGLLIPLLGEFKVDDGDEIFSVRWSSLISILWWTIASSSFDWLTRLFCSFPNHDKTLTVILNLHFENKNAVIWELKTHKQYTQPRTSTRIWTEVNFNKLPFTCVFL